MFQTLTGFRDFLPEAFARRAAIFETCRQTAQKFGFLEYDGPVLEPLDLYLKKSGEEIVSQLFNFQDKGGKDVSLRPEMTPTLARYIGANFQTLRKPVKWFTLAENFRFERPQKGRLRSHFQLNADIFGESGVAAEAELIALLISAFKAFGLTADDVVVRISDRELWLAFLKMEGIDEASHLGVLGVIDKMERVPEEKTLQHLEQQLGGDPVQLLRRIRKLCGIRDFDGLEAVFRESDAALTPEMEARLSHLQTLFGLLDAYGLSRYIRLDLGIVRGLAYYTGLVFEAFEASGEGRALAGGGRYDHLVEKLGGPSVPAIGFGLGDVTLGNLLDEKGLLPDYKEALDVFIVSGKSEAEQVATRSLVMQLREAGLSADFSMKSPGFGKQFKEANLRQAEWVVVLGSREIEAQEVNLKQMSSGVEETVSLGDLIEKITGVSST